MKKLFLLPLLITTAFSPFKEKDSKLYLNYLNTDLSPVRILVKDTSNNILYSEVLENEIIVSKVINFQNAYPDVYTVHIVDNGENISKKIKI